MSAPTDELDDLANELDAAMGYPAFRGFIQWAWNEPSMRAQFTAQTGRAWPTAPKNGLEVAIDNATGYHDDHAEAFLLWATREHWGDGLIPPALRERAFPSPTPEGS